MKRVVLKKCKENNYSSDIAVGYGLKLEKEGWINDLMEGGYISPDMSTIFYYSRFPYIGQLIQFRANREEDYNNIIKNLKNDFVEVM